MKILTLIKNLLFRQELSCGRRVVLDDNNIPKDVAGLQLVSGNPYTKDAVYIIVSDWDEWDYLGNGLYMTPSSLQRDMLHPESVVGIRIEMERFKKLEELKEEIKNV